MWEQPQPDPEILRSQKSISRTSPEPSGNSWPSERMQLVKILITQAFLTVGRKLPSDSAEGKLFFDGWMSALKEIPTDELKDAFSDALSSGKPMTPGNVCQGYLDKTQEHREEIKRRNRDEEEENPFPFHAKLRESGTDRTYSFALREPALCQDCGRPAEVFRYFGPLKPKMLLCAFHGESPW